MTNLATSTIHICILEMNHLFQSPHCYTEIFLNYFAGKIYLQHTSYSTNIIILRPNHNILQIFPTCSYFCEVSDMLDVSIFRVLTKLMAEYTRTNKRALVYFRRTDLGLSACKHMFITYFQPNTLVSRDSSVGRALD